MSIPVIDVVPVYQRFWWPHPYAEGLLWRKVLVRYRYLVNGQEVDWSELLSRPPVALATARELLRMPR